jgi:outer membrane lipoprotein carrier protein
MNRISVTLSLALLLAAAPAGAGRLQEVLAEMKKAGDRLKTLTADFRQTDHDFILEDEESSAGKLYLAMPGRIRWEYAPPRERILLVKDGLVRLYNKAANQVNEFRQGQGGKGGGADLLIGFGKSNDAIAKSYDASLLSETLDSVGLSLVPKPGSSASLFTRIELEIDKKTWTPRRSVFHEPNRDRTEIRFDNLKVNPALPARIFELELPANVEIIRN